MQVEEHNAQHSFHQKCRNPSSCTQDTSPASSPEKHSCRGLFCGPRHSGNRMLCSSMRTLLRQVTPRTVHLQLKTKTKQENGITNESFGCKKGKWWMGKFCTFVPCISVFIKSFAITMDPKWAKLLHCSISQRRTTRTCKVQYINWRGIYYTYIYIKKS